MSDANRFDAVVVGSGPNGLAAGIELARNGLSVVLYEAASHIGGGVSSDALTEPGFVHDLCSSIHPLALASPFLRTLHLERYGLEWVHPALPCAHPLDGGDVAVASRDLDETAAALGDGGSSWKRLFEPLSRQIDPLMEDVLRPILHVPRRPFLLARFGLPALLSAERLARLFLRGDRAPALFAGIAAHSLISLKDPGSSAVAMMLGAAAHAHGWPFPRGGAQKLADAMAACFIAHGGTIVTDRRIDKLEELNAKIVLLDVTPRQFIRIAGRQMSPRYLARMRRYRYGPGVFKVDYALSGPVPWTAAACSHAGTIHLGGSLADIAASESAVAEGRIPEAPFVLTAQHSQFDESRAPDGKHTFWAYCHVPNGSAVDMTARIDAQIERFAPGFQELVIARFTAGPADLEHRNANLVGGDINGGAASLVQLLARPTLHPAPYRTPIPGVYLCSASTPPGGGVHGMCGFHAARTALKDIGADAA